MPNPWKSSIILNENLDNNVYQTWLKLSKSKKEFFSLIDSIYGIPNSWLEWVEKEIGRKNRKGININKPLPYRLTSLLNGIIALQETKFICDILENALRKGFIDHVKSISLCYKDINMPDIKNTKKRYEKNTGKLIDENDKIDSSFVIQFSFYQLTETMARNWEKVKYDKEIKQGFRVLFWLKPQCRDKNLFVEHMNFIKDVRNTCAHTKNLLRDHETKNLFKKVQLWLIPFNVDLKNRIRTYRTKRPLFLNHVTQ